MSTRLSSGFYDRCFQCLNDARNLEFVVPEIIPIPYFGNLRAYFESPIKILTAALNPSDREFPTEKPRFNVSRGLEGPATLEAELSSYFCNRPYGWFSNFEKVLNGCDATYGGRMRKNKIYNSTALHIDICTPLATKPTWSGLTPSQRLPLLGSGQQLFDSLIGELRPDILIASLGWSHLEKWRLGFKSENAWTPIVDYKIGKDQKKFERPISVNCTIIRHIDHSFLFIHGSAANTPFGKFSDVRKVEVGRLIKDKYLTVL